MIKVRIVEIPKMKAAYSGPLTNEEAFEKFNKWFSEYHASLRYELFPRDFMWYNEKKEVREWFYALPCESREKQMEGFEIVDLPHGLFAVASCLDADIDQAEDWLNTREEIVEWVNASGRFRVYENCDNKAERYPMFHIISPGYLIPSGISMENLYVPIEEK